MTRLGKVKLERGDHVILFTDLPARAMASSIRVEGKATGRLEIGSVDSRRMFVPRTDDAVAATERKRIEDAIEKLQGRARAAAGGRAGGRGAEDADQQPGAAAQPARRRPTARAAQPDWAQLFGLIGQRFAEAQKTILDTQIKMREVDRQIKDLEGKLASAGAGAGGAHRGQDVRQRRRRRSRPTSPSATRSARASWVPFYDARLATGTKAQAPKLQLVRRASIQQRSGESWDNVALALSTTRPGAGTAAPELSTMTVDYEPDAPPRAGAGRRLARRAAMARDAMARVAALPPPRGALRAKAAARRSRRRPRRCAPASRRRASRRSTRIAGRVTVPTTGEAKRVQIDEAQLDPALTVRTVPKRDQKAYLYAKMTMARGTPILPGQVSLFRDATFVGNGRLPLLAPGEEHELGFGVDDSVRVRHTIAEEKRGETGIITSSKTDTRNYRITVKNLHERAIQVAVIDQIPVSQNADIKIELLGKTRPPSATSTTSAACSPGR